MKSIRKHLTFSNALASLALFVALGGSAYAVSTQSVGTKELKNRAVTTTKIRNGAVTAPKVRANAVTTRKIRNGAVRRNKIANGAIGTGKIANGAVNAAKIAAGSVDGSKIAPEAIDRSKLNLSALGALPAAARADSAAVADRAEAAGRAETAAVADSVTGREIVLHRMSIGDEQVLATKGGVSIHAQCITLASQTSVRLLARTSTDGSILISSRSNLGGGPDTVDFLNVGTAAANREIELIGSPYPYVTKSADSLVLDPDNKGIIIEGGGLYVGVSYGGADCTIGGVLNKLG